MLSKTSTLRLLTLALTLAPSTAIAQTATQIFSTSILQTPTALPLLPVRQFEFTMADVDLDGRPDLVIVKKQQTGTGRTEVHVLSAASNFQRFIVQTGTALSETGDNFTFAMADMNGDRRLDLVAVKKSQTGTRRTELHVLSGASNFQQFIVQTGTGLGETGDNFDFTIADADLDGKPDLVGFKKSQTSTGRLQLHVLPGKTNFQTINFNAAFLPLPQVGDNFAFSMADVDGDRRPDLVAIQKKRTGTRKTEIRVLSAASGFQQFIVQTGTVLGETGDNFAFSMTDLDGDRQADLVAIKKNQTGTGRLELHGISASSNFQRFNLQTGTGFGQILDRDFNFAAADLNNGGKPDLVAIQKNSTGNTEVRLVSGESNFQEQPLRLNVPLSPSIIGNNFDYTLADWDKDTIPDLVVVNKNQTSIGRTTVEIYSGQSLLLQQKPRRLLAPTSTSLGPTGDNFDFAAFDWDRDGTPDLVVIKKNQTGTGRTTVEVLSGASGFQQQILPPTNTSLAETTDNFDFAIADSDRDGKPELIAVKKNQTVTNNTEVQILQ
ncbi:MAG: VCBS repeat-containing protein [Cyanosarcina radialis HA8281-LM2]|jgi:hypothetical protein|nr:VCBS repeat-containing protein [Cyanosarcina radialis HA8281-LM2]